MRRIGLVVVAVIFLAGFGFSLSNGQSSSIPDVPAKGMVTMVDIGAHKCIPCKMMAPIIESLQKEYKGKAAIVFIDVWENREQGQRFGIHSIPTQIFYDNDGKEVYRHEGFLAQGSIEAELAKLGVKPNESQSSNL
ncbi:Thioredoxin domain-containing protein [Syntrophobacter sp. SbD1]|nr:Thioredoxin domain-containing protein [Syntrophobacter sp. SbD1]